MGIFSFLNRDQDLSEYLPAPAAPALEEPSPGLPEMCREMPIEVVEKSGRVLNTGLITEHGGTELTMGRHPGGLSFKVCEPGSTVYIRGCDNKMNQFYLRATVSESTRIMMKLKELEPEVHENHRDTFRLAVNNVPISIYYLNDERFERPEECKLVDISTGGLLLYLGVPPRRGRGAAPQDQAGGLRRHGLHRRGYPGGGMRAQRVPLRHSFRPAEAG